MKVAMRTTGDDRSIELDVRAIRLDRSVPPSIPTVRQREDILGQNSREFAIRSSKIAKDDCNWTKYANTGINNLDIIHVHNSFRFNVWRNRKHA
jgi:hypothetical protein